MISKWQKAGCVAIIVCTQLYTAHACANRPLTASFALQISGLIGAVGCLSSLFATGGSSN